MASALPCPGNLLKVVFLTLGPGCFGWHPDLLDAGSEQRLPSTGRGLRECSEGLLQEADRAAELAHLPAPWQPQQRGSAKGSTGKYSLYVSLIGDEHLHHRCAQSGHRGQDDPTESGISLCLQLAVSAPSQVVNRGSKYLFEKISLGGTTKRDTATPTSVTLSSSTVMSTWATLLDWSSLH